jgi:hypothetical protein
MCSYSAATTHASKQAKRLTQLSTTFLEIDWLHAELGIPPPTLDTSSPCSSPSPPSPTPDPFLSASTPTPSNRTKPPTPLLFRRALHEPSDTECHRIFTHFVARVDEAGDDDALRAGSAAVPIGLEHVDPTPGLLAWAATTRAGLEETKRRREAHIQAMYDELEGLWRRLGVPEADMDGFVEAHRGTTEGTMRAYEEELERMLELKRESMGEFVRSARVEIVSLWEDLMVGEEERADFAPFVDGGLAVVIFFFRCAAAHVGCRRAYGGAIDDP